MASKRCFLVSLGLIGAGILIYQLDPLSRFAPGLSATASLTLVILGILSLATQWGRRPHGKAFIRLDHFLPFARKKRQRPGSPSYWVSLAHHIFPKTWFFNPATGTEGTIRRFLRHLGPGSLASPWRRAIQGVCFTLFLILFFYVCWPYNATPKDPLPAIATVQFQSIDQNSGLLTFESLNSERSDWKPSDLWHLELPEGDSSGTSASIPIHVINANANQLTLVPVNEMTAHQLDQILFSQKPLAIYPQAHPFWPAHYTDNLNTKEIVQAELFLMIDPLVSLSTAIASRQWVWSLGAAISILILCLVIPRGFCGYVCPLGTLIDLFDRFIGQHVRRFRVPDSGWWVHLKYYLLAAVLLTAGFGVLTSGYVSAIPVITRGFLFIGDPIQTALFRGWHLIPPFNLGHVISIFLFVGVLALGLLRPRFWCKYVCPSGALFSLGNLLRVTDRKVDSSCIHCNKCVTICPFDAIKPDFTTRGSDCTQCQSCGGVCPTHSIKFVERWNRVDLKAPNIPPTHDTPMGRRGFLSWVIGSSAAAMTAIGYHSINRVAGANLNDPNSIRPIRPPGSVPEQEFLQQCIRCGECFKACPNNVLQPMGFAQGLEGLWTPEVKPNWAGCESSCNACGQVCPTGAIRALPLEEKKAARMGLAIVNEVTCLPFAEREACQLCVDECNAAGYEAIEFTYVGTETDDAGIPIPDTGYLAPVVLADKCVGCGLCQTRCHGINVDDKGLLNELAIVIEVGEDREDRLLSGSYLELRQREKQSTHPIAPPEADPSDPLDPFDPFADVPE